MSDIAKLQLLIIKEQQRGDELDEKMANEQGLLEEAEDKKQKIMREILQEELAALQEQNMRKEQELIDIQKRKICTLEEVSELKERFPASVSFLFLNCIF